MTQEVFPEIEAATQALQKRIDIVEAEIAQLKEAVSGKKQLVRRWKKAISAVTPKTTGPKRKARQAAAQAA